jgi:hypothetical protein
MRAFKTIGFHVADASAVLALRIGSRDLLLALAALRRRSLPRRRARSVDVLVESSDGGTNITVVGPKAPVFTAYQKRIPNAWSSTSANVKRVTSRTRSGETTVASRSPRASVPRKKAARR